jgi:hypothetical protein
MEFLLIHDLAVLVSRENAKFVEPIPAGVKDFQFAGASNVLHINALDRLRCSNLWSRVENRICGGSFPFRTRAQMTFWREDLRGNSAG